MTREHLGTSVAIAALLILLVGVGAAPVGADTDSGIYIEEPGTPVDLISGDQNHTISEIHINTSGKGLSDNKFLVYIDLSTLTDSGVDTSDMNVEQVSIENGDLDRVEIYETEDGNSTVQLAIEKTGPNDLVQLEEIVLSNLSTDEVNKQSDTEYLLSVTDGHSNATDVKLLSDLNTVRTETFDIVDGTFQFRKQATGSSFLHGFTQLSITVEDVLVNADSTLFATFEDENGDRIVSTKSISSKTADGDNEVTLDLDRADGFPGSHTVHLLPNSRLTDEKYESGDKLPENIQKSTVAHHTNPLLRATIEFGDLQYGSPVNDSIKIQNSQLFDQDPRDYLYIISLHPIDKYGVPHVNRSLGTSTVMSGTQSDIRIELKDRYNTEISLLRNNQYAAIVRPVSDDHEVGERVSVRSAPKLPNSGAKRGFIKGGVFDIGTVEIESGENISHSIDRSFNSGDEYDGEVVYAGEEIAFSQTDNHSQEVRFYQEVKDNREVLTFIDEYGSDSDPLVLNTTNLETGQYFLKGGDFDSSSSFKLLASDDQYSELVATHNTTNTSDKIKFRLEADAKTTVLTLTDPDGNDTMTATLSTPRGEPVDVALNTYLAGDPEREAELLSVDGPATVDSISTTEYDGPIPAGNYTLAARAAPDGPTDDVTATLAPRSTDALTTYTTADTPPDAFDTAADVVNAITTDDLTPADAVHANDTVVYAANASGLNGFLSAADPTPETGDEFDSLVGLTFTVVAATTDDADGDVEFEPRASAEGTTPIPHDDGLFLVANASETLDADDSETTDLVATFDVEDGRLRAAAEADTNETATHAVNERLTYVPPVGPEESTDSGGSSTDSGGSSTDSGGSSGATRSPGSTGGGSTTEDSDEAGTGGASGSGGSSDPNDSDDPSGDDDRTVEDGSEDDAGSDVEDDSADAEAADHDRIPADWSSGALRPLAEVLEGDTVETVHSFGTTTEGDAVAGESASPAGGDGASDGNSEPSPDDGSTVDAVPEDRPTIEDAPLRSTADDLPDAVVHAVLVALAVLVIVVGTALRRGR